MWETWQKWGCQSIFKNTTKHHKIFSKIFFGMQPNTWKYFPFPKIFSLKIFSFLEYILHPTKRSLSYIDFEQGEFWHGSLFITYQCEARVRLVSSGSFYWTCWIVDMCPLLDTCPNLNMSSGTYSWNCFLYILLYIKFIKQNFNPTSPLWFPTLIHDDGDSLWHGWTNQIQGLRGLLLLRRPPLLKGDVRRSLQLPPLLKPICHLHHFRQVLRGLGRRRKNRSA